MRRTAVAILFVAVTFVVGCTSSTSPSGAITYNVSGSARHVFITYANSSGGTSQTGAVVPWSYSWSGAKSGDFLYVSAQIDNSPDSGSITVSVSKDGHTCNSATANGFPSIATADCSY